MANIEYARTPLTVGVADKIAEKFEINLIWLATGEGSPRPYIGKLKEISPNSEERALLSRAFDETAKRALVERHVKGLEVLMRLATTWDELPLKKQYEIAEEQASQFLAALHNLLSGLSPIGQTSLLDMLKEVIRDYSCDWDQEQPTEEIRNVRKKMLTETTTRALNTGVRNQWHRLKQRIQEATGSPGGKSALAKFLGVDLTQLSKWLTNSKSAREPGADYTLKMLQWVQERESQQ
ncbi:MAG TPA: hypothetical protein VGY56_11385 [Verrucomicrobiae bacterium]|nr:hypothetical protein [Verrucomicrobiae bacterium]